MKKFILFASCALLVACTSESTLDNGNDNELKTIILSEHEITLEKGMEKVLNVEFVPENATNKTITWATTQPTVATVKDGVVAGVAPGYTRVIARYGRLSDLCVVTVIISAKSISLNKTKLTLVPGDTTTLKATVLPEDSTEGVEWSSSNESVATVKEGKVTAISEGEVTISAKSGERAATCSITVDLAVDLGLSVKWAACNIGATYPDQYGDYFAWGEVETKSMIYGWKNYKWCGRVDSNGNVYLTKYCTVSWRRWWAGIGEPDGKLLLEPADDVAHVELGGNWRIPTKDDWEELISKCEWHTTYKNGVRGKLVIGPNGNSIFMPHSGFISSGHSSPEYKDLRGLYWSSTLKLNEEICAYGADIDFSPYVDYCGRVNGLSIRPVSE